MKEYKELERAWGMLYIALAYPKYVTPEQAEELWETGKHDNIPVNKNTTEELIKLRKMGLTYREVGEIVGMKKDAVYNRIRRYEGRI